MDNKNYKEINYLKKVRKKYGLSDKIFLTNPYLSINYGRKIELMPKVKYFDVEQELIRWFNVKVMAYNFMYDLVKYNFKNKRNSIPIYYYKNVFDDAFNSIMLNKSYPMNDKLYEAFWDIKIPNDIILYAFASAQGVYRNIGDDSNKASYENNKMIQISASHIIAGDDNTVYIDPLGFVETSHVKPTIYRKRKIAKIYMDDYNQYYLRLGRRKGEQNIENDNIESISRDPVTGFIIENHKVIEL